MTSSGGARPLPRVAVLGAGTMGRGMTHSLLRNGFMVDVWDRTPERAAALAGDGYRWLTPDLTATTLPGTVDEVLELWAHEGVSRSHLAGYSQGGMFCYQTAAYRRERYRLAQQLADFNDRLLESLQRLMDREQVQRRFRRLDLVILDRPALQVAPSAQR